MIEKCEIAQPPRAHSYSVSMGSQQGGKAMKTAAQLFPEAIDPEDGRFLSWKTDYTSILNQFGYIVIKVDDDDYQGDSRVLYEGYKDEVGYLQFGWGSCSGCDALQG